MPDPYADTLATVAARRDALVARLRAIAARLEVLPVDSAAEVLVLLEPAAAALERNAALALERAPRIFGCSARLSTVTWADGRPNAMGVCRLSGCARVTPTRRARSAGA